MQKLRYIANTSMVLEKVSDIGKIRDDQEGEDEGRYAKKFLPVPADSKRAQFILSSSKE